MNFKRYARHLAQGALMLCLTLIASMEVQAQCGDFLSEPLPVTAPVDITVNLTGANAALNAALIESVGTPSFSKQGVCDYQIANDALFTVNLVTIPSIASTTYFSCSDVATTLAGGFVTRYLRLNGPGPGAPSSSTGNFREIHFYVYDMIPPTITCPAPAPVNAGPACTAVVAGLAPTILDNCPSPSLVWSSTGATISSGIGAANGTFNKGTTTITYNVSDASGNTNTCSFNVVVNDATAPTLTTSAGPFNRNADATPPVSCRYTIVASDAVFFNPSAAADNCGTFTLEYRIDGGSWTVGTTVVGLTLNGTGVHTIQWRSTDGSSNVITNAAFTVNVADATAPVITCPTSVTLAANLASALINPCVYDAAGGEFDFLTASDNCDNSVTTTWTSTGALTQAVPNPASTNGQILPVGTTIFTWKATDNFAQNTTCSFAVTIQDQESPIVEFIPADGSGGLYVDSSFYSVLSNNCFAAVTIEQPNFNITDPGYVCLQGTPCANFSVEDCAGYTITRTFNSLIDGFVPAYTPNDPLNRTLTANFPVGITYIQYVVTDMSANNNTAVITVKVEVKELTAPTAICKPSLTLSLGATAPGTVALTGAMLDNGSTDNCGIVAYNSSVSSFGCGQVGAHTVTLTVIDAAGNFATCNVNVTVNENTPPVILCPNPVVINTDPNTCTKTGLTLGNMALGLASSIQAGQYADNCGVTKVTWLLSGATTGNSAPTGVNNSLAGITFNKDVTTVTYTVADLQGNQSVCNFTVNVKDGQAPRASVATPCPADVTVNANIAPGCSYKKPNSTNCIGTWCNDISFTDNCDATITPAGQPSRTQTFNLGANVITINATDAAGNVGTCSFTITVADQTAPTALCNNITRVLSATNPGTVTVNAKLDLDASSFDNCYLDLIYEVQKGIVADPVGTSVSFGCGELGMQTVTFQVTEDGGTKSSTKTCTVTIQDNTAPTLNCPGSVTVNLSPTGLGSLTTAAVGATATDNCASPPTIVGVRRGTTGAFAASFPVSCTDVNPSTPVSGQLQVSDGNGNMPTCSFTVVVKDITPPNFAIVNDGVIVNCASPFTSPVPVFNVQDECNGSALVPTQVGATITVPGTCAGAYTLLSTYQVADLSGNTAQAVYTVNVIDNIKPTITLPANTTLNLSATPATCTPTASYTATLTDNCTGNATLLANATWSIDYAHVAGAVNATGTGAVATGSFGIGDNFITFTTTDNCGNANTNSMKVTVVDNVAPSFADYVKPPFPSNSSYCGSTFTYDITSGCTYGFNWYRPYAGPTLTFPPSLTITPDITDCQLNTITESIVTTPPIGAVQTQIPSVPFNSLDALNAISTTNLTLPVGTSIFTYLAVDVKGNTASCSFTVQVNDKSVPTITCPNSGITINSICPTQVVQDFRNSVVINDNCSSNSTITQQYLPVPATPSVTLATVLGGAANVVNNATFPMTFTVSDNSGNTASCVTTVTLKDIISPSPDVTPLPDLVWNCGFAYVDAPTAKTNDCGVNSGVTVYGTPGGVSANGVATLPGFPAIVTKYKITSPPGTYFITWSYNDGNNNVSTQLQKLTINPDIAPPVAKCKTTVTNITLSSTAPASAAITPVSIDADNGSFTVNGSHDPDNCGAFPNTKQVTLSLSQTAYTCADLLKTSVVLTATDAAGNTATCSAQIKVIDNTLPVITATGVGAVPANITVDTCTIGYTLPLPANVTATDNCSAVVSFVQTSTQGTSGASKYNYVVTRVWTATDAAGNTATGSQTITIRDVKKPEFATLNPASLIFTTTPASTTCAANVIFKVAPFVSDCAPDNELNIVVSPSYFSLTDTSQVLAVGTHPVTFTVTDPAGNTATTTVTFTVKDATVPIASCINGISITLNANGQAIVTPNLVNNSSTDNCTPINSLVLQVQKLKAINGDTLGVPTAQIEYGCNQADNDTEYPFVLWVTDASGNRSFCETYVVVQDNVTPVITCPASKTIDCTTNLAPSANNNGTATATDNCPSNVSISFTDAPVFNGYTCGNVLRTWKAKDLAGNASTCVQTFTIEDTKPPVFNTPLPQSGTISCGSFAADTILKATDNCTPADSIKIKYNEVKVANATGICGSKYKFTTTRTWTATDKCNNTATYTQVLVVKDTIGPRFLWGSDTIKVQSVNFAPTTNCTVPVVFNAGASNIFSECALLTECTVNSVSFFPALANPITPNVLDISGNYPVGTTRVIFNVTDPCGNIGIDTLFIKVTDNSSPVAICNNNVVVVLGNNGQATIGVNDINLNSNDNCGIAPVGGLVLSQTQFDCQDLGFQPVTLTVTDIYGNTNACTVSINVKAGPNTGFALNATGTTPTYFGASDGTVKAVALGGSNSFTYNWNTTPAATTATVTGVPSGTYIVTVTDSFTGCQQKDTIVVVDGPKLKITVGNATGVAGTIVKVPVYADNLVEISGFSFSIDLTNLAVGTIVTPIAIVDKNPLLTGTYQGTPAPDGSTVGILYLNGTGANVTLPNGALLFNLCIQLSGAAIGTSSPLVLDGTPVQFSVLRTTPAGLITIPADAMNGSVQITLGLNDYDIVGDINPWQAPTAGVPNVAVALTGGQTGNFTTTATGVYQFNNIPASTNTLVAASKSTSGNTKIDIIDQGFLLNHIFATVNKPSPLTSPYQRVAADVNFDGQINIIDFALIQRLLLGTVQHIEGASAKDWTFVPKSYMFPASTTQPFPNPTYPLMPAFPQTIAHNPIIQDELNDDFVAVRMGDLNGDAPINFQQIEVDDRSDNLLFRVQDRSMAAGETVTIPFRAKDFVDQQGYQVTFAFDPNVLELKGIVAGDVPGLDADANFGTQMLAEGFLSTAWINLDPISIEEDAVLFSLTFRATHAINALSANLRASADVVAPLAFTANGTLQGVDIEYIAESTSGTNTLTTEPFVLYQNQPNPFQSMTTIGFRLPKAERATLKVFNANGQLVKTLIGNFEKGYNAVQFHQDDLGANGIYYYELSTPSYSARKKMVLID